MSLNSKFRHLKISIDAYSLLWIVGEVENTGSEAWSGFPVSTPHYDAIGIKIVSWDKALLSERRIHLIEKTVAPGESFEFRECFSAFELGMRHGTYEVHVGMLREGVRWFSSPDSCNIAAIRVGEFPGVRSLEYVRFPSAPGTVALTFDAEGSGFGMRELIEALNAESVRCTFFVTGKFVESSGEIVQLLIDSGHEIGNHTFNHYQLCKNGSPDFSPGIDGDMVIEELEKTQAAFYELTGKEMTKLWRAPHGYRNSRILAKTIGKGYTHFYWSWDLNDWKIGRFSEFKYTSQNMLKDARHFLEREDVAGEIMLFHSTSHNRNDPLAPAIRELIRWAKNRGIVFATIGELVRHELIASLKKEAQNISLDSFPDFFCIGAQKSGTTWLFHQLEQHQEVYFPCPLGNEPLYFKKEAHFFDRIGRMNKGLHFYLKRFLPAEEKLKGDMTPNYSALDVSLIRFVKELKPNLKIIFIMRDPVERAISHVWHILRGQRGEGARDVSIEKWREMLFSAPVFNLGNYAQINLNWSCFPEEQRLIIDFAEISDKPERVLERVCDFLGIPRLNTELLIPSVHERRNVGDPPALDPELIEELREIYRPTVRLLSEQLPSFRPSWILL